MILRASRLKRAGWVPKLSLIPGMSSFGVLQTDLVHHAGKGAKVLIRDRLRVELWELGDHPTGGDRLLGLSPDLLQYDSFESNKCL